MLGPTDLVLSSGAIGNPDHATLVEAAVEGGYAGIALWPGAYHPRYRPGSDVAELGRRCADADEPDASSGQKALEELGGRAMDVVITDLNMPGMDGIQLLEEIKKTDEALPVIIMTAYASQKSAIDALNSGAFQYLEKHAKNDEIKLAVKNALEDPARLLLGL